MADGKEESINIVQFLKTNSGKKGEGMPVVRNPQFYFREEIKELIEPTVDIIDTIVPLINIKAV